MVGVNLLNYVMQKNDTLGIPDAMITNTAGQKSLTTPLYTADLVPYQLKAGIVTKAVTVLATATSGTTVADATIISGTILGITPTGNQDQFVDNVAINGSGVVTVTLAAAATADNTFSVSIKKA